MAQYNADPDSFKDQEVADYVGLGVHCAQGSSFCSSAQAVKFGQTSPSSTAVTDSLPDEPGGYDGFQALFGHKYLQPQLVHAANSGDNRVVNGHSYQVYNSAGNLVDLNGNEIDGAFLPPDTPASPASARSAPPSRWPTWPTCRRPAFRSRTRTSPMSHEEDRHTSGLLQRRHGAQGPGDSCYAQTLAAYN